MGGALQAASILAFHNPFRVGTPSLMVSVIGSARRPVNATVLPEIRGETSLREQVHKPWHKDRLQSIFVNGAPSNDLSEVGLIVHCFDNTEDESAPWKPATTGRLSQFAGWWSTSIINSGQNHTLRPIGI